VRTLLERRHSFVALSILLLSGSATADVATFDVTNIDFHVSALNGLPPLGGSADYFGSARFTWTYTAGDFAGGTGTLGFITNPFGGSPGGYPVTNTVDLSGFSTTLAGSTNIDSLAYDIAVNFAPGLTGPTSSTMVSGGSFDLTGAYPGLSFLSGEFTGTITGGQVTVQNVPEPANVVLMLCGLGLTGLLTIRGCIQRESRH